MKKKRGVYRTVQTRIWNDAKFLALDDDGRYLFLRIVTGPEQTSIGAMRVMGGFAGFAAEMGWTDAKFSTAFDALRSAGMAKASEGGKLIVLPNFLKHDKPEAPNVVRSWTTVIEALPECELKNEYLLEVEGFLKGLHKGFIKAFREALPQGSRKPFAKAIGIQEQEQEQDHYAENARGKSKKPAAKSGNRSADLNLRGNSGKPTAKTAKRKPRNGILEAANIPSKPIPIAEQVLEISKRIQAATGEPIWRDWYESSLAKILTKDGGQFVEDVIHRVEDAALGEAQVTKGIGAFRNPGAFIVSEFCKWMKTEKIRWDDYPIDTKKEAIA